MSRHNKLGPPGSPRSVGTRGEDDPQDVPVPVVQQAQHYLEENVKAWMQPSSRDVQLPQVHSSGEQQSVYQHPKAGTSAITRQALQSHNLGMQQRQQRPAPAPAPVPVPVHHRMPPVTSPSSGYSDSYYDMSFDKTIQEDSKAAFPHSLSFGGCSQHSAVQGTSYSTPCGNSAFGITQPSAAASFFARAAQRLNLSTKKKRRLEHANGSDKPVFRTNFYNILKVSPPSIPPGLLRNSGRKDCGGIGKVKVMLRMHTTSEVGNADSSYISVDGRKKQVTLYDPTVCGPDHPNDRHTGTAAPKMFAFDTVFSPDDDQAEVCSSSLCEVINSVVAGSDGCLFVYGHSKLGKTCTMIGQSNSTQEIGVVPSAIWWLFRAINEHKHRTGARFSVRVSAVEVSGKIEELRDLLADYAGGTEGSGSAPGVYLRDDPVFGTQLMNQSELRAPNAERAAYLLDAALAARTPDHEEDAKNAHFLFTLHVYQYRVEKGGKGGVAGGRSRLHLFDLASCDKLSKSRDGVGGGCLSLSALGNVILALFNGQKHVPYKDSKLTQLLREALASVTCRAAMIAHVSTAPSRYPETLATLQLASRIHRLRKKKLKFPTSADAETDKAARPFVRMLAIGDDCPKSGSSDQEYTSSSEQSCDTVIFVGSGRGTPMPGSSMDRKRVPTVSPLAKESRSNQTGTPKKSSKANKTSAGTSNEESMDNPAKSAFNPSDHCKQSATSATASPKKKLPSSPMYSSLKHQKVVNTLANNSPTVSPKSCKYATLDNPVDAKKAKYVHDVKGSPAKSAKCGTADPLQKVVTTHSAPNSPQSPRKSKRSHNKEHGGQSANAFAKVVTKEPKPSSDETWIDGPRFTKPKFDSRTLHQLQKEKWVDGPGLYGYMDPQKETMVRRWVEDHAKPVPNSPKEVWIDFPKTSDKPSAVPGKIHPDLSDHKAVPSPTHREEAKRDSRSPICKQTIVVKADVEPNPYAKPNICGSSATAEGLTESRNIKQGNKHASSNAEKRQEIENVNDNVKDVLKYLDLTSDENSNSSVDLNDNDSDDLSSKLKLVSENDNSSFSRHSLTCDSDTRGLKDSDSEDNGDVMCENVPMVDSCIQVTEEDIYSTCGWPQDSQFHQLFQSNDHPLRMLSAEDLNLPSSFTDSRAASIDFDRMSVPETWSGGPNEMDPDLTWNLLRGNSFSRYKLERDMDKQRICDSLKSHRNQALSSKMERLARLRELFEAKGDHKEQWKPFKFPDKLADIGMRDNRIYFSSKLHHSADSSLEELRDHDTNSIHSEPAGELDVEKFDFQFNVKPMNGLRLEAFYNKMYQVPQYSEFGKPTQIVPPIVKQPKSYSRSPFMNMKQAKDPNDKLKVEDLTCGPYDVHKRWSDSFRKPDGASDSEMSRHPSETDVVNKSADNPPNNLKNSSKTTADNNGSKTLPSSSEQVKQQSLVEVIHEQRCQVYSELPSVQSHCPAKHSYSHRTCKSTKVITEQITNVVRNIEVTELKNDNHKRKKSSLKFGSRGAAERLFASKHIRSKNAPSSPASTNASMSPKHCAKSNIQCQPTESGVSSSTSWCQSPLGQTQPYLMETHIDPNDPSVLRSHLLYRSTSTPTSPFLTEENHQLSWPNIGSRDGSHSYVCCGPTTVMTPSRTCTKWNTRPYSSGNGSDSSILSGDAKESKERLGCMVKTPKFSGTSSGYESMPRDSESTPLSSSSHESGSELDAKRDNRGRKGTKKKSQGSNKRSRSVPARPPLTHSPTWQALLTPTIQQPMRPRGRLMRRDLHDPSSWKSEEDVCCTSLLCCRLLDFY